MSTPLDTYIEEVQKVKSFLEDRVNKGEAVLRDELNHIKDTLQKTAVDLQTWRQSQISSMDDYGRLYVREGRFAGLTPVDLAIVRNIFMGRRRHNPDLVRRDTFEQLEAARASLRSAINQEALFKWEERTLKSVGIMSGTKEMNPGYAKLKDSLSAWRQDLFGQLNKALDSTTAAAGDELVATLEAAELWMDVNLMTAVLPLFRQTPMPSNPFDIPRQLGDVNWYPVDENVQVTTTTPGTGKTTLTAYSLKAGVPFSDELEEDAIIALASEIRQGMARNAAEVIDDVLLNGDTTATNNINNDGVVSSKSTVGKAHYLLGFDGLYHLPYVDNTAQRIRVAGALANTSYNNLALKLGKYAAPQARGDVAFIVPVNVAIKTMQLSQVETLEKYGPRATISAGEISSIYGTPMIWASQFGLVDTTGAVRNASANNTTGRILMVNASQWRVGFRRQITFEPDREPGKSQTTLYLSFRIAFAERTGTRSSASHTAAAYDISSVT